jgi:hypothetical protein
MTSASTPAIQTELLGHVADAKRMMPRGADSRGP